MAETKDNKEKKAKKDVDKDAPKVEAEKIDTDSKPKAEAKAGKRSEKGLKEAEAKSEKIEKQKSTESEDKKKAEEPKHKQKPVRSLAERRSKKYKKVAGLIGKNKLYTTNEGIDLAIKTSTTKFDSSVELHIRLNVDPKQADQNIRGNIVLPSGTGKKVRVAVFTDDENLATAKKTTAEVTGSDDFLKQLDKEVIDFDVLIATPNVMAKLAKYARVLGPKGLMPNPKSGTVTKDIEKAVSQAKAGKIEYRVDGNGIVHSPIGKVSFGQDKLKVNADVIFESIKQNKPASVKSGYVKSVYVTTTMGPSIQLNTSEVA